MNELISQIPRDYKPKSFWERPEGVTGQIVAVSAIAGGGWLLYHLLPAIIKLLENTLYAAFLGVAAVAVAYVISDRRFWRLGAYLYQSLMRKITQVFVDPAAAGVMSSWPAGLCCCDLRGVSRRV